MEPKPIGDCTHFRHPPDEQLLRVDIFFSNYYNLKSVHSELKWMVGGQVNPIISIIIDDINNNNNNNNNNNQFLKWGRRKVFTLTASFRLQDLRREVQPFLCKRPRDRKIVTITAIVRNSGFCIGM